MIGRRRLVGRMPRGPAPSGERPSDAGGCPTRPDPPPGDHSGQVALEATEPPVDHSGQVAHEATEPSGDRPGKVDTEATEPSGDRPGKVDTEAVDPADGAVTAWRAVQRMQALVTARIGRAVAGPPGLSQADTAVLAELYDHPDQRMRPFELGRALGWEKSRLSHHLARMVARRLVVRQQCPSDQRGWVVALTDSGRRAWLDAAPLVSDAVRRALAGPLGVSEVGELRALADRVAAAAGDPCCDGDPDDGAEPGGGTVDQLGGDRAPSTGPTPGAGEGCGSRT